MDQNYQKSIELLKILVKDRKVKSYTSIVFSLLLITVFSFFALRPTLTTIVGLQKSIREQQEILSKLEEKEVNLSTGIRNYQNLPPATKEKLDNLLPDQTNITTLVKTLTSISAKNQASISGLQIQPIDIVSTPSKLPKTASLQEVLFNFNVSGGYKELKLLLQSLSKSPRLLFIESVSINKQESADLIMRVNGKAYITK